MTTKNSFDLGAMTAEFTARAAILENPARHKRWIKFKFADGIALTNEIYSPGSTGQVKPLPLPFDIPDVTVGTGMAQKTFKGHSVPIQWKVTIDKTYKGIDPKKQQSSNMAGSALDALFGGGSP